MGDLKTTPMQTPRESCPPSTGRQYRQAAVDERARAGAGTREAWDSYNDAFDSSGKKWGGVEGTRDVGVEGATTMTMGVEEETPRSRVWGDMSPGEHGGSQYVMSPAREYSQCDSGSDGDIGASGSPRRDDVLRDRAVNGGEKDQQTKKVFPIFRTGRKTVHLVRHGESTWNAQFSGPGSFEEPKMSTPAHGFGEKASQVSGGGVFKNSERRAVDHVAAARAIADVHHRTPSGIRTKGGAMEEAEG